MTVPDVNLLLHAYNSESPIHDRARTWWEDLLNGSQEVGLTWVAMLGFVRTITHRSILASPLRVDRACSYVRSWLVQPVVGILHPGSRHAEILFELLNALGSARNLTTDAHLAAITIEHQAELHSTDADFARFPGLRWKTLSSDHIGHSKEKGTLTNHRLDDLPEAVSAAAPSRTGRS